jgi:E3 ubiquitin-protein ligase UBR1/E3 ubiquitin-protein ligase UBR3
VGIFLLLRSTQLLLLRNNRTCMGLSLYLDIHGEEDLYLRRSQLLYLSDLRLNEIRRLWMTAAFDYDSYILRNSQSRPNVY